LGRLSLNLELALDLEDYGDIITDARREGKSGSTRSGYLLRLAAARAYLFLLTRFLISVC